MRYRDRKRGIVVRLPVGRPATGADPLVTFRLPQVMIDMLDSVAEAEGVTRSDILRELIDAGLNARKLKRRPKANEVTGTRLGISRQGKGAHLRPP